MSDFRGKIRLESLNYSRLEGELHAFGNNSVNENNSRERGSPYQRALRAPASSLQDDGGGSIAFTSYVYCHSAAIRDIATCSSAKFAASGGKFPRILLT